MNWYDCPDRVDYAVNNGNNAGKFDAVIKSGHRDKDADKHDVNGVSGHSSGHDNAMEVNRCKTINQFLMLNYVKHLHMSIFLRIFASLKLNK